MPDNKTQWPRKVTIKFAAVFASDKTLTDIFQSVLAHTPIQAEREYIESFICDTPADRNRGDVTITVTINRISS